MPVQALPHSGWGEHPTNAFNARNNNAWDTQHSPSLVVNARGSGENV